jgi:hypothetical protein
VRERYLEKLKQYFELRPYYWNFEKAATLLNRAPEAEEWVSAWTSKYSRDWLLERLDPYLDPDVRKKIEMKCRTDEYNARAKQEADRKREDGSEPRPSQ